MRIRSKSSRLHSNIFNIDDIERAIRLDPENKLNLIELKELKKEKNLYENELKLKYLKNKKKIENFYENENLDVEEENGNIKCWYTADFEMKFE